MESEPSTNRYRWDRDWVTCPGETLAEWFAYTGMSSLTVQRICRIPEDQTKRFLAGDEPLTDDLASKLQNMTGIPASFWLRLETNYREGLRAGLTHEHDA